jgi:hypothetical protein
MWLFMYQSHHLAHLTHWTIRVSPCPLLTLSHTRAFSIFPSSESFPSSISLIILIPIASMLHVPRLLQHGYKSSNKSCLTWPHPTHAPCLSFWLYMPSHRCFFLRPSRTQVWLWLPLRIFSVSSLLKSDIPYSSPPVDPSTSIFYAH